MMNEYVKVKFPSSTNREYIFKNSIDNLKVGDYVIVDNERGLDLVQITGFTQKGNDEMEHKDVLRLASNEDINTYYDNVELARKAKQFCQEKADSLGLDMHVIKAEYNLVKTALFFTYISSARVDFRDLLKILTANFKARIDLRQIGSRDRAKIKGGLGVCGQELCCSRYMKEFEIISVNMAKNQLLAINSNKLLGQCDKLKCCLLFENEAYVDLRKNLPSIGSYVTNEENVFRLSSMNVLNRTCKIENRETSLFLSIDDLLANYRFIKNPNVK